MNKTLSIPLWAMSMALLCHFNPPAYALRSGSGQSAAPRPPAATDVSGTVKDEKGEGIPGVNVLVKGTATGTTTDVNGKFSIQVGSGADVLVFSFVGYAKQEVAVGSQTTINITLAEDNRNLDEVVVVGYGTQKKVTLTGAVVSVNSQEIVTTKNQNVQNMLTGKLPGLRVVQKSSEPGDFNSNQFDIRGFGNPLIVIDGVPRDNISRIDPNEIESISILKDAAAAIYGVRAANGVVLVTTKRGASGRAKIEYSMYYGSQTALGLPKPVGAIDRYTLMNEKSMHNVNSPTIRYSESDFAPYREGKLQSTDWYDLVMQKRAPQQQHNLSASGGTSDGKVDYFINMGYMYQEGFWKSKDLNYDKYNLRSNINAQITKQLRASLKLSGIIDTKNNQQAGGMHEIYGPLWRAQPNETNYANNNPDYLFKMAAGHPVALTTADISGYQKDNNKWLQSQFQLEYTVPHVEGLMAKGMFSYDTRINSNTNYKKSYNLYDYNASNGTYAPFANNLPDQLTRTYNTLPSTLMQVSLNYNRSFKEKHNVGALVLYEESTRSSDNFYASRELGIPMEYLFAGKAQNQVGNSNINAIWKNANKGLVGRLNYDFKGKYIADFSFRYDGSSKFPPGKQWGFFPAVSAGWRLSEEGFIKNNAAFRFLDNLKIRGSYGTMGDDGASSYQFVSGYDYPFNGNSQALAGGYMFGGSFVNSLGFRNSPNPNITWYTVKTANAGLDAGFWNGLVEVTFDIFRRNRTGLLANRLMSLPGTFGATMPQENLNSDQTSGFEVSVSHRKRINEIRYNVSGNLSLTRTRNIYIERGRSGNSYDNWRNNRSNRFNDVWFGWGYEGQFQSYEQIAAHNAFVGRATLPGDYIYEDWNSDGTIDDMDRHPIATTINPASNTTVGGDAKKNHPLMNFGFSGSIDYKGFDLNILFQGAALSYVAYGEQLREPLAWDGNALEFFMDRWHPNDPTADPYNPSTQWTKGYYAYTGTTADENSARNIQNGAYLRLKSAEIGYSLPKDLLKRVGVQGLRVYVNGYNLHTFTKVRGLDPEHPSELYGYMYPINRTINVGASISF
ncbi:SusC/RagA family TonB-linked outer membrane protein [Dyadobacter jiangsuensis]